MTTRSLFPEGVEIHQNSMVFERDARIDDHIQSLLDESSMGVQTGFAVTVNGVDTTKIDVALGAGYAPAGEYVELAIGQSAIALASGVLGTVNLVCAIYEEVESEPGPHETGSTSFDTKATRSCRLRVYTVAQFNALAATDANLANDAQDRALILARVTATGGALTAGSIVSPTAFDTINYASQPITVTGVSITGVSSNTAAGTGALAFTFVGTLLTWTPPGGAIGPAVNVGGGGTFTLLGGGGSPPSITVEVISASLPGSDKSDSITITALYGQTVARFSADDWLHRSLKGTGTPTPTNPHGLKVSDLGGIDILELETHQDIQHANGIWRGSGAGALALAINEIAAPDELVVTAPAGADTYYVNGKRLTAILNTSVSFAAAPATAILYEVLVDDTGAVLVSARATWPDPRTVTGVEIIDVSDATGAGPKNLVYTNAGQYLKWDGGPNVAVAAGGHFRLISANDRDTLDVFVVAASLPGGNQTDAITVSALASTDAYLRIGMVCWTGSATGFLGFTSLRGGHTARTLDKRAYGTLDESDLKDELFKHVVPNPTSTAPSTLRVTVAERTTNELRNSGVVVGLDRTEGTASVADSLKVINLTPGAGLNVSIGGGVVYIFGKRFELLEQTGFTLDNNVTQWVYLDVNGVVQKSPTLTLLDIVGNSTLNEPGLGIVLAKVTTAGGNIAVNAIIDYRRNISHLDSKGVWSVASSIGREKAQFFSLRAALDYAQLASISVNMIRVVGTVQEDISAPINIMVPFEIVVDPDCGVYITSTAGAPTSAFSLTADGALIWRGGTLSATNMDLLDYSAGVTGRLYFEGVALVIVGSGNLIEVNSTTVEARGIKFRDCKITVPTDQVVEFYVGFSGGPLGFYSCDITATASDVVDTSLSVAGTIERVELDGCNIVTGGNVFNTDADATIDDWKLVGCTVDAADYGVRLLGSSNRLLIRDNYIDAEDGVVYASGAYSQLHTQIVNNTLLSLDTADTIASTTAFWFYLLISGNKFPVQMDTGDTIDIGTAGTSNIVISDNQIARGRIILHNASRVSITGNIITAAPSATYAIVLDEVDNYAISGNSVAGSGGISVDAPSENGEITGNLVLLVSGSGAGTAGISGYSPFCSITGNSIKVLGDNGTTRYGILSVAGGNTIVGNTIEIEESDSGARGISVTGTGCTIASNSITFTDAAAAGKAIYVNQNDNAIVGNQVFVDDVTCTVQSLHIDANGDNCTATGNKFEATASVPDVLIDGDRVAWVGNVISTEDGGVASVTINGVGGSDIGNVV